LTKVIRVTQSTFSMKSSILRLLACSALGALVLGLAACGGGGSGAAAGPGSGSSFAGSTVTINPTLAFGSGNTVTYTNIEAGSAFPAAADPGLVGTYSYTPSADATTGTLVVSLPAPIGTITFLLRGFQVQSGNVTSFEAVYAGRAFSSTVTSGTLPAKSKSGSGGGGSLAPNEKLAPVTPTAMQGVHHLTFHYPENGAPFTEGQAVMFTIGASTLQIGAPVNKTLTSPIFRNDNPYEWIFRDGSYEYAASIGEGETLNEINLAGPGGFTPFYGQFNNRE
jgi:hypothetical protein